MNAVVTVAHFFNRGTRQVTSERRDENIGFDDGNNAAAAKKNIKRYVAEHKCKSIAICLSLDSC